MSLPNATTITCGFNQRDVERKERLKIKLTKRIEQNPSEQIKSSIGNKFKCKPCDNNIDDLVRFIDGNEKNSNESTTKKNKKKKDKKQNKTITQNPIVDIPQPLSKRKQKAKLKLEQQEKQIDEPSTIQDSTPPVTTPPPPPPSSEKTDSNQIKVGTSSENPISPEEEVNWITISRKQSKHKPTPVPSLLAVPIAPPNNNTTKQKRQQTIVKTKTIAQQKVIPETVQNSNKQHTATAVPARVQNSVKPQTSQQQKLETPSAWTNHEQAQGINIFLIFFPHINRGFYFIFFSGIIINPSCNSTSFCSIFFSLNTQ